MKLAAPFLLFAMLAAGAPALGADAGSAAIASLGQLNGVALACQQPAIASRARNAVQTTAPKTRTSGETFEQATNDAFLAQGKGRACPDTATLAGQLKEAENRLQEAFPAAR